MKLNKMEIRVTTAADGTGAKLGHRSVLGLLYAVQAIDGDFADGVDLTLTCEHKDLSSTLLVKANFDADGMYYPRALVNGTEDGAALTGTAGGDRALPIVSGVPKLSIAAGGNAKTGG
ncbi:MAG: hypothetical protein AAGU05_01115, partial [Anaerolineaceae bacterium]